MITILLIVGIIDQLVLWYLTVRRLLIYQRQLESLSVALHDLASEVDTLSPKVGDIIFEEHIRAMVMRVLSNDAPDDRLVVADKAVRRSFESLRSSFESLRETKQTHRETW